MQDFFRVQEGQEEAASLVLTKLCKKLVKELHYVARIQAVVTFNASYLGNKLSKKEARTMVLAKQDYLRVTLDAFLLVSSWCIGRFLDYSYISLLDDL